MTGVRAGSRDPGTGIRVLLLLALIASGGIVGAQHEQHQPSVPGSRLPDPGWEPIRCWRQSSAGAVRIGETFTLVLTCAAYEGDNARVLPDESRLGVASIQLAPFEIVGGSHSPDVRRGSRRFFQYEYQLRIISPDAIGHDVNIPALTISYRIQSRVGAAATLEGRDLTYLLPMMPIKVLSLVPADASDIRDASEASLAAVDSLRFRSSLFQVLAIAFGSIAAALLVLAIVPIARARAGLAAGERDRIPDRSVLASAIGALAATQSQASQDGWTDARIADALALVRLVAAAAIDQHNSQKPIAKDVVPEGRLVVHHGLIRPVSVAVSSSITATELARARQTGSGRFSTTRLQQLEGLQSSLTALTSALYRKEPARDSAVIEDAVRQTQGVARDIAAERGWVRALWARR